MQIVCEDLHPQEIEILYDLADAVALPARGEGFNLPAAEAMARGRPVIATGHSGHLDFCNDANARLVDFAYKGDLVNALQSVYQDGRGAGSATSRRARRVCRDAAWLRWR